MEISNRNNYPPVANGVPTGSSTPTVALWRQLLVQADKKAACIRRPFFSFTVAIGDYQIVTRCSGGKYILSPAFTLKAS